MKGRIQLFAKMIREIIQILPKTFAPDRKLSSVFKTLEFKVRYGQKNEPIKNLQINVNTNVKTAEKLPVSASRSLHSPKDFSPVDLLLLTLRRDHHGNRPEGASSGLYLRSS